MNFTDVMLLCFGGALGAVFRFWISRLGAHRWPQLEFPLPTLFVNVTGSAVLGLVFGVVDPNLTAKLEAPPVLFFGVGFCGAYTTFSSFCTETIALIAESRWLALLYVIVSILGSIAAFVAVFLAFQ